MICMFSVQFTVFAYRDHESRIVFLERYISNLDKMIQAGAARQ